MKRKKLFIMLTLVLMVTLVTVSLLTACSRATVQGMLANLLNPHSHERYVYDVIDKSTDARGTYTVTLDAHQKDDKIDVSINGLVDSDIVTVQRGVLISGVLAIEDTVYTTGCYFNLVSGSNYMLPAFSFRSQEASGKVQFAMYGTYSDANYSYKYVNGDEEAKTGSFKIKGLYYDNNEFKQTLRCVTSFESGFSLAFSTPLVSPTEQSLIQLTAVGSAAKFNIHSSFTDAIEAYAEDGVPCYAVSLARATEVRGMGQEMYYAADALKVNGWELKNVLVKFVEHQRDPQTGNIYSVEYTLRSADIPNV